MRPNLTRLAVIGALAAAFALGGCGRKGPLDLPPSAAVAPAPAPGATATAAAAAPPPAFDEQGKPVAPKGERRQLPLDVLLN